MINSQATLARGPKALFPKLQVAIHREDHLTRNTLDSFLT